MFTEKVIRFSLAIQSVVSLGCCLILCFGLLVLPHSRSINYIPNSPINISPDYFSASSVDKNSNSLTRFFSYTLEGRDEKGQPVSGWDLDILRSVQDETVKPALESVDGVERVISSGGFVVGNDQPREVVLNKSGAEAVGGIVHIKSNANLLLVNRKLQARINEISETLPQIKLNESKVSKLTLVPFYNQTDSLKYVIITYQNLLLALFLIMVFLTFLFLVSLRAALLVLVHQVLTLCLSMCLFKIFNLQFNMLGFLLILVPVLVSWRPLLIVSGKLINLTAGKFKEEELFTWVQKIVRQEGIAFLKTLFVISFIVIGILLLAGSLFAIQNSLLVIFATATASILIFFTATPVLFFLCFKKWKLSSQLLFNLKAAIFILGGIMLILNQLSGLIFIIIAIYCFALPLIEKETIPRIRNSISESGALIFNKIHEYQIIYLSLILILTFILFSFGFGFSTLTAWMPESFKNSPFGRDMVTGFPGLEQSGSLKENQSTFSISAFLNEETEFTQASRTLKQLNLEIQSIDEVDLIMGKVKPANSGSESSRVYQLEAVIKHKPEFSLDQNGYPKRYLYDYDLKSFIVDQFRNPIEHSSGKPYRNWGKSIEGPDDIWREVEKVFGKKNIVPVLLNESKLNLHQLLISVFAIVGLLIILFDVYIHYIIKKFNS